MMNYSLGMAESLVSAGRHTLESAPSGPDGDRTALYLGLLASELTLKHLLESAGLSVSTIRRYSHNFEKILAAFSTCTVEAQVIASRVQRVPASRVRRITIDGSTVGSVLLAEARGASKYPNEVRYGASVYHVRPDLALAVAESLLHWSQGEGATIMLA